MINNSITTNKKINLFIVTHKNIEKPIKKKDYYYIGVGNNKDDIIARFYDNSLDNISKKNGTYCELTVQYWIWKNVHSDIVGLVHYRRFFYNKILSMFRNHILSSNKFSSLLKKYDVVIAKQQKKENMSAYDSYCFFHYQKDIDEVGKIIEEKYPKYTKGFEALKNNSGYSPYNMIVTKKNIYDDYSEFLFGVLFELEKRIDISSYDEYQKRIYGFLGERLLNVYLWTNDNLKVKYQSVVFIDNKNIFLNYWKKVFNKLFPKKDK